MEEKLVTLFSTNTRLKHHSITAFYGEKKSYLLLIFYKTRLHYSYTPALHEFIQE